MFGVKLFNVVKNARRKTKLKPMLTIGRSIFNGDGQRTIVKGFTGANLDAETHFKFIEIMKAKNYRVVVRGFGHQYDAYKGRLLKQLQGTAEKGKLRFFPIFRTPKMKRHVVLDMPVQRDVITGFGKNIKKANESFLEEKPVKILQGKDLLSEERVVVQGFKQNTLSTPEIKKMDLTNNTPRVVVKGFRA